MSLKIEARYSPLGAGNTLNGLGGGNTADGLSPLTRGTLRHICDRPEVQRFIPADAGNTLSIHICF